MSDDKVWPGQQDADASVDHGTLAEALQHVKDWVRREFGLPSAPADTAAENEDPNVPAAGSNVQ